VFLVGIEAVSGLVKNQHFGIVNDRLREAGAVTIAFGLRNLSNFKDGIFELGRVLKPGGRLLVLEFSSPVVPGFRQAFNFYFNQILPRVVERGVHAQVVTSAVRPIPSEWIGLPRLQVVVSIDGLQPEHDERRKPATYERILKHIEGQQITVHCTVTRQQARRDGYLEEFLNFWQANSDTRLIWISLYTPQVGELSMERLTKEDRAKVIADLRRLRPHFSKLQMLDGMLNVYATPPQSPEECIFAQTTECFSSDLERRIAPCQFGGKPDCENCGCIASAGLEAIGRHRLHGGLPIGKIFYASLAVGRTVDRVRRAVSPA